MAGPDASALSPVELLGTHPFVVGMEQAQLARVAECVTGITHFASDQVVFHSGGVARVLYLLRSGDVALEVPAPGAGTRIVATLHGGDALGWSWLFPPYTWHFDARATEDTRLVTFDGLCLRTKCEKDPALGFELMKRFSRIMTQRIEALSFQLMDVYGDHA